MEVTVERKKETIADLMAKKESGRKNIKTDKEILGATLNLNLR